MPASIAEAAAVGANIFFTNTNGIATFINGPAILVNNAPKNAPD